MILQWKNKDGGTGTVLSTVNISVDGASNTEAEITPEADELLNKISCRVFYFPTGNPDTDFDAMRAAIAGRLEALKVALKWKPPTVKRLSRAIAVMPNIYNNFGDLVYGSGPTVLLANCCLFDSAIEEDSQTTGLVLRLTFAKVSAALT